MGAINRSNRREFLHITGAGAIAAAMSGSPSAPNVSAAVPARAGKDQEIPVTGVEHEKLAAYDELMLSFMREHKPPGAALAVAKAGRLVYARGFGHADHEKNEPVEPLSMFRLASLSKSLTSAAIFHLVERGKLKLEEKVFEHLKLKPHFDKYEKLDPRLREVTVLNCLQHTAGWDRERKGGFDPMGAEFAEEVAKTLKKELPITPEDIIRVTFGRPLDFDPGTKYVYSNFGYCVLGRMIEMASGRGYEEYVQTEILKPLGIHRMRLGKNLLVHRAPTEVKYYDSKERTGRAISGPKIGQQVPLPYGVECIETMDANGGWIASAVEMLRFITAFDDVATCPILKERSIREMLAPPDGLPGHGPKGKVKETFYGCGWEVRPVNVERSKWTKWHMGLLAGSSTLMVCRSDDINWVALFNSDATKAGKEFAGLIDPLLHGPADKIKDWPEIDMFERLLQKK